MCHLILMMPLLSLPVFWLLPLSIAAPAYAVVLGASAWLYWHVTQSMHRPVQTGKEEILNATGRVIKAGNGRAQVRLHSEIWAAESVERLRRGDRVQVIGIDGLRLRVRRLKATAVSDGGHHERHA